MKPSVTTTSAAPSSSQRLSTLPAKRRSLSARSLCASCVAWLPFAASSPIESRPTSGSAISRISSAKIAPIVANCTRCSGRTPAFAPASISTDGPFADGMTTGDRRTHDASQAPDLEQRCASMAPVFPAETAAAVLPAPTDRQATSELSGLPARPRPASRASRSPVSSRRARDHPHAPMQSRRARAGRLPSVHLLRRLRLPRAHGHRRARRRQRGWGACASRCAKRLDLTPTVRLARGAHAVRLGWTADRADREARRLDLVLRDACRAATSTSLRDSHERPPSLARPPFRRFDHESSRLSAKSVTITPKSAMAAATQNASE